MNVIGTVSHLVGRAVAIKSDGTERVLALGDEVYADEMVRVAPDAAIEIAMDNGEPVRLEGGQNWLANSETYQEANEFDLTEAIADVESIQAAILAGADPTEVAEETAAGGDAPSAGAQGNEGATTVNIQRTAEEVDPTAGYETTGFGRGDDALEEFDGIDRNSTEALIEPINAVLTLSGPASVIEGEAAVYTLTLDRAATEDVTVVVQTGNITTDDGDLIPLQTGVTIPAGSTSTTFEVQTNDDAYADSGERFNVGIESISGGGFDQLTTSTSSVETEILDQTGSDNPPGVEDTTTLNIAGPATVVEGETATYTVSVTNPTATDLVVSVVTGHITTDDGDLVPVTTDVTIAAGSSSTTFDVVTRDDAYADNGEEFTASITGSTGGGYENLVVGTGSVTTEIQDQTGSDNPPGVEDTTTLNIAGPATVVEGETATYTVSVTNPTATDLVVSVVTGHITTDNGDLVPVTTDVTIAAGTSSTTFDVVTRDDAYADNGEEFTASITGSTGGGYENLVVGTGSVTTEIQDQTGSDNPPGVEDTTTLNIAGPATVVEGETATYTVSVTNPTATDLVVSVVTGHITTDDGDLVPVTTDVTIAAGTSSTTFDVVTRDDAYADNGEEFTASITGSTGGGYENLVVGTGSVTTEIQDQTGSDNPPGVEDTTTLNIAGPATVVEGETATYTVSVTNPTATDLVVSVVTGHITTDDGDLVPVTTDVTIAAGTSSTTFDVVTRDDAYADNGEEFTASITGSTGGGYENLVVGTGSVTTEIQDQTGSDNPPGVEDTTTLNIAGPATVVEGETATYTVSVTNPTATDLVVSVVTGHITTDDGDLVPVTTDVTIAAGTSSTTFDVVTRDDAYADNGEEFTASITGSTGGGYENLVVGTGSVTTEIQDQTGSDNPPGVEDTNRDENLLKIPPVVGTGS